MIKILVDTASDIDKIEAENLGIDIVPMLITFGKEEFLDGINLTHTEFFEKLIESNEFPKTSQINEFTFEEKFKELTNNGDQVICITISSKLSGTFNNAKKASKNFPNAVYVVDSMNACIGERVLVQLAMKLIKENKPIETIIETLEKEKNNICVLAVLDTLKYLKKGGRISPLVAFAGELFSVKPVISIVGGEVKLIGKAIGSKNGNNLLCQLINKSNGINFDMPYCVGYSGLSDLNLKKYLKDSENIWKSHTDNVPVFMIGSTIGTHAGPGAIAVSFFKNE